MSTEIPLTPGVLPSSCYSTYQALYEDMFRYGTATLAEGSLKYIIGNTAPGADDREKLWIQTDALGNPIRQWIFNDGAWVWPHPVPPNDGRIVLFNGLSSAVASLDGGVSGTAYEKSGPFWEIVGDLAGRFPIGVGTLEDGTAVGVTDTGGQERVTLTSGQIPDHVHKGKAFYRSEQSSAGTADPSGLADSCEHESQGHTASSSQRFSEAGVLTTEIDGESGQSHPNLPPYYGVYFIKRTIRKYYTSI